MVTLDAILDDAKHHPFSSNTTVLNADQFHTIRGPSSTVFRARLDAALADSTDLAKVQQLNADDGLEVIEPVQAGIRGGYWYLRNLTRSGETFPAGEAHYRSIVEALEIAIQWWQAETWCRGVMVRNYDVNHSNAAGSPGGSAPRRAAAGSDPGPSGERIASSDKREALAPGSDPA